MSTSKTHVSRLHMLHLAHMYFSDNAEELNTFSAAGAARQLGMDSVEALRPLLREGAQTAWPYLEYWRDGVNYSCRECGDFHLIEVDQIDAQQLIDYWAALMRDIKAYRVDPASSVIGKLVDESASTEFAATKEWYARMVAECDLPWML